MTVKEKIDRLRAELHRHNYNYYVLNAPEILTTSCASYKS